MPDNETDTEQRIREQAYALWEQAGSPHGREDEFWTRAKALELGLTEPVPTAAEDGEETNPIANRA